MGSIKSIVRALATVAVFAAALLAQNNRITGRIDARRTVALRGSLNPIAQPQFDEGRVDSLLKMDRMTLLLKPTGAQQAALEQLLTEQQDPSSPNYHNWLTPEQFADRFGLSADDIAEIVSWLKSQGFVVDEVARGRNWIAFSGTAGLVESAFATEIHHYRRNGERHFSNATDPLIPAVLEPLVIGLRGLDDIHPKPAHVRRLAGAAIPGLYPDFTFGGQHYLVPDDLATIYDLNPLYGAGFDGTGQKIVIAGQSSVDLTNINRFRSIFNLSVNTPQTVLVGTDPGQVAGDIDESYLDLEWAGAVARGATIIFVYAQDVTAATQSAINQNLAPIISWSYGSCEIQNSPGGRQFFRSLAQQAVAQGITWVSSSGDSGAADCETQGDPQNNPVATQGISVDLPASVPEVTGVGGTRFNDGSGTYWNSTNGANSGSALSYIPEMSWNDTSGSAGLLASGGGASIAFSKPVWQTGTGVPNDGARDVPDVSLNASNYDGYIVCKAGSCAGAWPPQGTFWVFGGTSASAPSFAGMLALMQQYLIANHFQSSPGLGNINPTLYRLAQNVPAVFHDVVSGNNIVPCGQNTPNCPASAPFSYGYNAGSGYDQVTGLGSVDGNNLITNWSTDLCTYSLSPTAINVASGAGSGSVTISTQSWCSWNALRDSSAAWLTITSSTNGAGSGSLSYSVTSNNTSNPRTGTLHISGQTFTITQNSPGAAPSLSITKTHTGSFAQGQQNATYTVTVSNGASAGSTSGTVTVTETVPSGLTLVSLAGTGWTCGSNNCTRGDALAGGSSYPAIIVTVNVAANAISPQVNSVSVSGGGSATANATDSTIITPTNSDLALGKTATQSSTYSSGTGASNAVDGNTDGNFTHGSVTHTNLDANAWWQVDLGASAAIGSISIWNRTECCPDRLNDYWVFVSNTPFGPSDTPATLQSRAGTWSNHQTGYPNPSTTITLNAQGRYVRVQLSGTNYLSLAEVQVYAAVLTPDLAQGKTATQSSTYNSTTGASNAVDGNTDGNFTHGSVTHTNLDANAWWQVDLGASATIGSISIWNRTECCPDRLNDYWVFVSNTPFAPSDTPATLQNRAGTWSSHQTAYPNPSTTITLNAQGRYVRVQLSGTNYLSLAEVQVYAASLNPDLAQGKTATQSSTYDAITAASNAVDGNTDGNYFHGSITHTNQDANAWWQVDLGASAAVSSISIWNRTDCCPQRLNDYWVFVSDTPFGPSDTPATLQNRAGTWSSHQTAYPNPSTSITLNAQGRYVRVQLSGTNYLSLAEVQVFGH